MSDGTRIGAAIEALGARITAEAREIAAETNIQSPGRLRESVHSQSPVAPNPYRSDSDPETGWQR